LKIKPKRKIVVKKTQPKNNDKKDVVKKTTTKPVAKKTADFSGSQNKSQPFVQTMKVIKKTTTKPVAKKITKNTQGNKQAGGYDKTA
jgi:hypothetical protein